MTVSLRLTADADVKNGGADDDTFTAGLTVSGNQTLQAFDRVDGGEGTDTLKATIDTDVTLTNTVKNVENFFFRDLADKTVTMTGVAGVEQVWSNNSLGSLNIDDVENVVTVGVVGGEETAGVPNSTFTVDYTNVAVVTDAEDADGRFTQAVALDNASAILDITANGVALAPTSNTTLELDLTGESNVDLGTNLQTAANGVDTITTSGDGSIDLDLGALTGDLTVTLGAGDDTLRLDGSDLDANDTIDLGEGDNTLTMSGIAADTDLAALDLSGVTNAGALGFADALTLGADATLDLEDRGEVTFEDAVTGAFTLTADTTAADLAVNLEAGLTGSSLEVGDSVSNLTLNAGTAMTGAAVSLAGLTNTADTDGNTESLETLTLVDVNADAETAQSHSITLGDGSGSELDGLTAIDLSAAGQRAADGTVDDVTLDATNAGFTSPVSIQIGEAELTYTSDAANLRETFQFVGDEISDASVTDFNTTAAGNGDRLDFSQFDGVDSLQDLAIVDGGTDITVSAADGQFEGTITLTGLTGEQQDVEANGFIF